MNGGMTGIPLPRRAPIFPPAACRGGEEDIMPLELGGVSRSRDVLAEGRTLYLAHCAVCHGADGNGRGSMAAYDTYPQIGSFRDEKYAAYSPGKMFRSIRLGQGNMPAFGNILTAREIWCLVAFVRRLQALPAPPQEERPVTRQGEHRP